MGIYEGRSLNSGTSVPLYHMAERNLWKFGLYNGGFEYWNKILFESVHSFKSYLKLKQGQS